MRIINPYQDLQNGSWLRGNLHTHTNRSDGSRDPQAVVADYAARGYDFLAISDHDIQSTPEDYASIRAGTMTLIPANEITANGPHLLHVGGTTRALPYADRQRAIDDALASGGIVIVNHPNWGDDFGHCPIDLMRSWQGFIGIELFNGICSWLTGSPYGSDKWDMLLSTGRRVWGFAHDDHHGFQKDIARGWNMVYAKSKSIHDILDALQAGRFYASTGVTIRSITVLENRIRVVTDNATRVAAFKTHGMRFAEADDRSLEIVVPDDASYVRFDCFGSGETRAWTQPFFIERS